MINSEISIENNSKLSVDNSQSKIVRLLSHFFSYIFHPLFIPLYVTLFLMYIHPSYFAGYNNFDKFWLPLRVAYGTILMPIITVLLLKQLKFINSFFLTTQRDRIIPYIACGIYFFWLYLVFRNDARVPNILTSFMFGVFLASSGALIANIYYKISMHAIGVGGILGLFIVILQSNTMLMTVPLTIGLLIAGIVCTSRLIVSDHQSKEIYTGLLLGAVSQFVGAYMFT